MNKVVIVTGGSRGIGSEVVRLLAENGYKVILNYNKSEEKAKIIKEECTNNGYDVEIFKADVSKREEVKKIIEYTIEKYGTIDVIVNNAGIDNEKLFQDITDEDWNNVINTNLYSVFCMCQEVAPIMINKKEGLIINISSIYGTNGGSFATLYSATKAGIIGLTKSLAKELGPSNIRVNAIAPGIIDTDMNKGYSEEELEEIKKEIPIQKIGKGKDIAKCIKWLIEDNYTTGQVIKIDGGWYI